ncbi:MAG TPA: hypothetical protein VIJ82_18065 [Streptosporangiaceae bacterium]|jgi:hypothetical protein
MSAGDLRTQLPRALRPVNDEGGLPHLRTIAGSQTAPPLTVAALCQDFAPVCESAVDPLEIASALEFDGMSDQMVRDRYGYPDVFELAAEMYIQVPRQPAEPPPPADPWQVSRLQPVLHGLLYGLPAVCFPAAAVLLAGPGMHAVLIIALLSAWASSQGLAGLGYLRLGRTTDRRQAKRLLRAGLLAGLVLLALIMSGTALLVHAQLPVLLFGLAEGAYMLGACVLLVLGAEKWLLAVLAPGVLGSAAFLALGRPPNLQHASWAALAATPVLAVVAALVCTRGGRGAAGRLVAAAELRAAAPAAVFGLLAAGLLAFPVIAGANGHGGVNVGALLATLPLSLSMGAAEWSLLAYRRRTRELLRSTHDLRVFGRGARLVLARAVGQYLLAAVVLTMIATWIAVAAGLVQPARLLLPELAVYLALGCAMFLALALQALGVRAVALIACAGALAFEIAWRELGVVSQLAACIGLLIVLGGYATRVLSMAVRHAF